MTKPPLWIFGYGSLMWNPGFDFSDRQIATLPDYHRSFCMRSIHHRGTETDPGLVLALDAMTGASCTGLGFAVEGAQAEQTLIYLRERELISSAYLEVTRQITLKGGLRVMAVTFVIDADHDQYCGGMALEEQAGIITRAVGGRGPNAEYLHNTADHLQELGIADAELDWLSKRVRRLTKP